MAEETMCDNIHGLRSHMERWCRQPLNVKLTRLRWPFSILAAMQAVTFMLMLWQAHQMFLRFGLSAGLRGSVWHTFAPVLVFLGTALALEVGESLSCWAAWRRARRLVP